jgi:hypothetical protein
MKGVKDTSNIAASVDAELVASLWLKRASRTYAA